MKAESPVRLAIAWLIGTLVVAHAFAAESYWVATDTLYDLAAQNAPYAWIARSGFIGFGVLLAWHYSGDLVQVKRYWAQAALLLFFGSTVALTGVFSTAPIDAGVAFSEPESILHSMFATMAAVCLGGSILVSAWRAETAQERWKHVGAFAFAFVMSVLFAALPEWQGVTQRLLWVGALWWLGWTVQ